MKNDRNSKQYKDRISSAEWFQLCCRLKRERGNKCDRCGKHYPFLEVHHLTYARLGNERDSDLEVLCNDCHTVADYERKEQKKETREKRMMAWACTVYGDNWKQRYNTDFIKQEYSKFLGRMSGGKYH